MTEAYQSDFMKWFADDEAGGEFVYYKGYLAEDFPSGQQRPNDARSAMGLASTGQIIIYQRRLTRGDCIGSSSFMYCAKKPL